MSSSRSERGPTQPVGFFTLPIEIRNDIYKDVLTVPHPLYLFQDSGGPVETFAPGKPYRWLALLYTNQQIRHEASAVLYGNNHFTLQEVETTRRRTSLLDSFFNCIGPANAGRLSRLCIDFPSAEKVEGCQSGEIRLREGSLQDLRLLQNQCTKLRTLETLLYGENTRVLIGEYQKNTRFVREVLLEINAQLRGIVSLNKVIVRIDSIENESLIPSLRELLQELGWVVFVGRRKICPAAGGSGK